MAFEIPFVINNVTGNDVTGDGITIPVATAAYASTLINADAARVEKYTVIVETDLVNDFFSFVDTPNSFNPWIKLTYVNSVRHYSTTSQQVAILNIAGAGSQGGALWIVGARISGFEYAYSDAPLTNFTTQFRSGRNILEDCDFEGYIYLPRMEDTRINGCRIRTGIVHSTNGDFSTWCLTHVRNCDLRGSNQFQNTGTISVPIWTAEEYRLQLNSNNAEYEGFAEYCGYNDFESCGDVTISLSVGQTYGKYNEIEPSFFFGNNWKDCNVNFTNDILTIPATWAAAIDADTMRSKATTDGVTLTPDWFERELFTTITRDAFEYQSSEADYILNHHLTPNRYAISQITPVANADYDFITDHYISNKTSPTPLVYKLTAPRAGKLRRLELQFIRNGNTEQLGTDGEVEITLEKSIGGVNFAPVGTFLSGIDSSTLEFDYVLEIGKAYKASIQPVGAAFGEIELYGMVGTINTMEDEISQSFTRVLVEQKGNNLLAETPIKYFVNPLNSNYRFYDPIRIASQVINPTNEFNNTYELSANELITRVDDPANPILPSTVGHMEIIYQDNDPITNPYNLEGYSIMTTEGLVIVKLKE